MSDPTLVWCPGVEAMLEFRPWTGGCPERHARWDRTQLTRGSDDGLMIYVYGNMRGGHRLRCRRCGRTTSDIPAKFAKQLTMTADLDLVRVNRCITYGPCEVSDCNRDGVERHHFAPRNVFGYAEARRWPTGRLCAEHHREWHRTMHGYRWNAPSVDSAGWPPDPHDDPVLLPDDDADPEAEALALLSIRLDDPYA